MALVSPLFESVPPQLYGGTERVVYNLSRGLTEAGVEVTLFASGDSRVEGVELVPIIPEALRLAHPPLRDPNACHFKMLAQVARRAEEFDVIHNHHDYWMMPLHQMVRTPVITTVHGRLDIPEAQATFPEFPDGYFISISNAQRASLSSLRWLRTIYHGLDLDAFKFYEKPGKYLAFLGRITAEKRPEYAIEIAHRAGVPLKIAAKIEGREGSDYYDAFVKPHVDGRNVEYIGEIPESEKSDFLGNALAMVFPIDWPEPFGLVMIESLACGTPVLARPCGSVPEILREGVTGFCSMNLKELADSVARLGEISRRGCREWVERKFSLQRMTEEHIHVYRYVAEFASVRARGGAGLRRSADHYRRNLLYPVQRTADGNS